MTSALNARVVILTGAGISAESGLRTFRAADGLWENHRVEDVATPQAFQRNPDLVYRFYNERRRSLATVQPNAAHLALARLEQAWSGDFLLVTQNVDDLHDRAGSRNLLHMHGELLKAQCLACRADMVWPGDMDRDSPCPICGHGPVRPHIVWFGEMPLEMDRIYQALDRCDLFLAIGTSGHVYPAAGFVEAVGPRARTLELNLEPSLAASAFLERRIGKATELVPAFVEELLG
ncbi:Sir2 family NAD+-dependent deacetylase [Geothrix sp. PMB-07]|uniref:Sir2 family NAD+-dependent deacetylase n=1 Tax=Geothrix sp. PMB-07 TaxID=3068640 RepID=UPI002740EA3C|nr:Sir2 family NAD+-dependent deacetylase [Geothrix sp. PMB-07]WLT31588.1 NAD-dependent protein deacylase [Geothrix sp. PMB-07]